MARALAVVAVLVAALAGCRSEPADPAARRLAALEREFAGSYPLDVRERRGALREYELTAAPTVLPLLDGRPLAVWAYNGQVPGPIFHATVGERLRVRFTNRLPIETTVHWHGVQVPNPMDGAPGLTQPPVRPGESLVTTPPAAFQVVDRFTREPFPLAAIEVAGDPVSTSASCPSTGANGCCTATLEHAQADMMTTVEMSAP